MCVSQTHRLLAGGLQIATGDGEDTVELVDVNSETDIQVSTEAGNDRVAVQGSVSTPLNVDGGEGSDVIDSSRFANVVDAAFLGEDVVLPLGGDVNLDGKVTFEDFLVLSANFGATVDARSEGDLDGDSEVTFTDFLLLSADFGKQL